MTLPPQNKVIWQRNHFIPFHFINCIKEKRQYASINKKTKKQTSGWLMFGQLCLFAHAHTDKKQIFGKDCLDQALNELFKISITKYLEIFLKVLLKFELYNIFGNLNPINDVDNSAVNI